MEADGGGWTLAWSYGFTNYQSFGHKSNAITPKPSWPASDANVPVSTNPPLNENDMGALDFKQWRKIGKEFMVKSNINHWIACKPEIGSLVDWCAGNLDCRNIRNVGTVCQGTAPTSMVFNLKGPGLKASKLMYFFEGSVSTYWPTHDPCGNQEINHLQNVDNPGGNIFIR